MKIINQVQLFVVINFLFLSIAFAQSSQQPGTFLKYSSYEAYIPFANFIEVEDIDNDLQNEVVILQIDTLIIVDSSEVLFLPAFNSSPLSYPFVPYFSLDYCQSQKKIISYKQEMDNMYWSYYYPSTNSFVFGSLVDFSFYSFAPDQNCNIWSVKEIDTMNYFQEGIFTSQDILVNLSLVTLIGQGDPSVSFESAGGYGSPPMIFITSNNDYISTVLIRDNIFTSGNPHGMYQYYSSDFGSNWHGEIVLRGNIEEPMWGQISNRNMAPYMSYYSILSGAIDDFGVMHLALWGIGSTIEGSDTVETSPILYWNSRDKNWIAISNPSYERMIDGVGNLLNHYAPAWVLGQSCPTISVSKDGQIVMVAWCVPEYEGYPGTSSLNIYPGDGGQYSTPIYYTDYLANISYDGGQTWSENNIFPLKNRHNVQEVFLSLNKNLIYNESTGDYRADYFYIVDEIPGNAIFNQNSFSDINEWYYDSLIIYLTPTNVNKGTVYSYFLSQNYPNPFNPSTTIRYEIPQRSFVSIKVYDILGNEIVTLLNEEKSAGRYEVEFNTSSFNHHPSSGVYFYSLSAGNYFATKKMILLK